MNIAIYIRVSTDQQAEKGYSLDTQLEACRQHALEMGAVNITEYKDDGYSGEYIERPALAELREALKEKLFDVVVVYDPDRLARNLAHQLIITDDIEKSGAELKFVSVTFEHSPEGKLFYSIRGAVSAYEKAKILERITRGKKGKLQKGKIISDPHTFGYRFDKENSNYIIYEEEADVLRKIYHWIVDEKIGTALMAKRLNELGLLRPRSKKAWSPNAIYNLIIQPRYKGTHMGLRTKATRISVNKKKLEQRPEEEWIEVAVPAIVDEVTWQAAQNQLKSNKIMSKRNHKRDQIFAGLVYCAKCGRKLRIEYGGRKPYTGYYSCPGVINSSFRYSTGPRCDARRLPSDALEISIMEELKLIYANPDRIQSYRATSLVDDTDDKKKALERINDREKIIINQRDDVLTWYKQQVIDKTEADKQLTESKKQLNELGVYRKQLINALAASASSTKRGDDEIHLVLTNYFNGGDLSKAQAREMALDIIEKVFAERTDTTRTKSSVPVIRLNICFC